MSLGSRYRSAIKAQHCMCAKLAEKMDPMALWILVITIVLFLLVGVLGIVTSFKMNEDANEVMAPVDSVYYQRYEKYKNVFYENSTSNYQPQWIMSGLGMYFSVVMYPRNGVGQPIGGNLDDPKLQGLDTMNKFFSLVEDFVSEDNKTFPELCAKHYALNYDQCYRMNMSEVFKPDYRGDNSNSLYQILMKEQGSGPKPYRLTFPSQKTILGLDTIVVSTAEILGSSKPEFFESVGCKTKLQKSRTKVDISCQYVGDHSEDIEALRYAWHLRYDTPEESEMSHKWILEVEAKCLEFEEEVNKGRSENDTYWKFMCYHSLSLSDGAKVAITDDMKWIVLALLLSLVLPVVMILKPCGADNFAMMALTGVGLFFVTLIGTVGVGSMLGFEFVYSFLVTIIFLAWIFLRLTLHMVESLKDYLSTVGEKGDEEFSFAWLCGHWLFVSISNFIVLSLTSFLICSSMYKIIWFTAGFFGVFFLLSSLAFLLMFLSVVSLVIKSRSSDGRPCCMGRGPPDTSEPVLDNKAIATIKRIYERNVIRASAVVKGVICAMFAVLFAICLIYSVVIFSAEDVDEDYYGYDRTQIVKPDDNALYMLEVLKKYYPAQGPLVQMVFNNNAMYHYNNTENENCNPGSTYCIEHTEIMNNELFPAFWDGNNNTWDKWMLSFYQSYVINVEQTAEKSLNDQDAVSRMFKLGTFLMNPLHAVYNDMARIHVDDLEPPYAPRMAGDPYTRMFIRQKYLSHTAKEVKFVRELEMAQEKLKTTASPTLMKYFPPDSFEFYSNLFVMYESSREVISRSLLIPAAVVGCIIFALFCACVSLPHPFAHLVLFLNGVMLFFEFFAIQFVLGTTINNFSMTYYFLMFLFAVDYSFYPVHINLKYILAGAGSIRSPTPSPIPSLVIFTVAMFAFLIMVIVPLYSLVAVAIRNCIFVFGVIGPLHELLFVPSICGLVICGDNKCESNEKIGNGANGIHMSQLKKEAEANA